MWSASEDLEIRHAAMDWLAAVTEDGLQTVDHETLRRDFTVKGQHLQLKDKVKGIWKPRQAQGALSISTVYRRPSAARPYDDAPGPDGLMRYKWNGLDPEHADNRALRSAMQRQLPLIWFLGVAQGIYTAVFPVYLVAEEQDAQQFVVATDGMQNLAAAGMPGDEDIRRWATRQTTARLHQPVFRAKVMHAYRTRCAVCELAHPKLLDAAHIVGDREDRGVAEVRNGLALCKIHHAAYDSWILGVTPDHRVTIRGDILEEVDGPMLEHGLKRLHGEKLRVLPSTRALWPDPELLSIQYERFLATPIPPRRGRYDLAVEHRGTGADWQQEDQRHPPKG